MHEPIALVLWQVGRWRTHIESGASRLRAAEYYDVSVVGDHLDKVRWRERTLLGQNACGSTASLKAMSTADADRGGGVPTADATPRPEAEPGYSTD
jgi:hypothetical protein